MPLDARGPNPDILALYAGGAPLPGAISKPARVKLLTYRTGTSSSSKHLKIFSSGELWPSFVRHAFTMRVCGHLGRAGPQAVSGFISVETPVAA